MIVKVNSFVITEKDQGSCYEQVLEGLSPYGLKRDIETNLCRALDLYWVKRSLTSPFEQLKKGEKRQLYIVKDIINNKLNALELDISEDEVSNLYNIEYQKQAKIKQEQAEIIKKFKEEDEEDKKLFGEEGRFVVNYTVSDSSGCWEGGNIKYNQYSTICHNYDKVKKTVCEIIYEYDHDGDYAPYHLELREITLYDKKLQASFKANLSHSYYWGSPFWEDIERRINSSPVVDVSKLDIYENNNILERECDKLKRERDKHYILKKLEHSLKTEGIAFRFKYMDAIPEMNNNQRLMNVFEYYISESIPECIAYYLYRHNMYQSKCDSFKEKVKAYPVPDSFGDLKICNLKDFNYIQTEWYDVCKDKFSELYCQYRNKHDVFEFGMFYRTIKSEWEKYFQQNNTKTKINKRKRKCK